MIDFELEAMNWIGERLTANGYKMISAPSELAAFHRHMLGTCTLKHVEEDGFSGDVLGCNGRGPITDEIYCPYCGKEIDRSTLAIPKS